MLSGPKRLNAPLSGEWYWFCHPGLCIALVGTSLALLNFGIDEFINPRLARGPECSSASSFWDCRDACDSTDAGRARAGDWLRARRSR